MKCFIYIYCVINVGQLHLKLACNLLATFAYLNSKNYHKKNYLIYNKIQILYVNYTLLNDKKKWLSKYLVLGPGAQRTFRLSSRTPRIPFNVLSRTKIRYGAFSSLDDLRYSKKTLILKRWLFFFNNYQNNCQ